MPALSNTVFSFQQKFCFHLLIISVTVRICIFTEEVELSVGSLILRLSFLFIPLYTPLNSLATNLELGQHLNKNEEFYFFIVIFTIEFLNLNVSKSLRI